MPSYNELSEEILKSWVTILNNLAKDLVKNPTKQTIQVLILYLCEYITIHEGFWVKYKGDDSLSHYKLSLKDMQCRASSNQMCEALKKIRTYADSIRHKGYRCEDKKMFNLFISDAIYADIWKQYLKEDSLIQEHMLNKKRLQGIYNEVYLTDSFYSSCVLYACKELTPVTTGISNKSIKEVVKELVTVKNCSKTFAISVVYPIIENQHLEI